MHVKVSKSNAKCFSQASGRGIVVSQKKNLLQSFGWAIKRLPTSSEDEEDAIIPEGQTIGEAVMILILKYCYIVWLVRMMRLLILKLTMNTIFNFYVEYLIYTLNLVLIESI